MNETWSLDRLQEMRGMPVYSSDGQKIGSVEEVFTDVDTREPEWVGVGTGFFGTKRVLVPLAGAEARGDGVYVGYTKDQVKGSPDIDSDEISQQTERDLYAYYGMGYSERRSSTGLPEGAGRGTATEQQEASVTRAEEELKVGTRPVEAGRVRLRKWVETEPVEADVQLRRERATVQRQPIDQPASGAELSEEEVEVPLSAEEAVVQKQTVAKERVSVDKDVTTQPETISEEVRRERVEVEGEDVQEEG